MALLVVRSMRRALGVLAGELSFVQERTMTCRHEMFDASVDVVRLQDPGAVLEFRADVRVTCRVCGMPFRFLGMENGYRVASPTVSVDGLEATMPIAAGPSNTPPERVVFEVHKRRPSVCGNTALDSRYGTCTRDPDHIGIHENALAWWDGRGSGGFRGPLAGAIDGPPQPKGAPLTPKGRAIEIIDKAREHQLRLAEHLRSQARELEGAARDHEATAEELRLASAALEHVR